MGQTDAQSSEFARLMLCLVTFWRPAAEFSNVRKSPLSEPLFVVTWFALGRSGTLYRL